MDPIRERALNVVPITTCLMQWSSECGALFVVKLVCGINIHLIFKLFYSAEEPFTAFVRKEPKSQSTRIFSLKTTRVSLAEKSVQLPCIIITRSEYLIQSLSPAHKHLHWRKKKPTPPSQNISTPRASSLNINGVVYEHFYEMMESPARLTFWRRFLLKRTMDKAASAAVVTAKIPANTLAGMLALPTLTTLGVLRVLMKPQP